MPSRDVMQLAVRPEHLQNIYRIELAQLARHLAVYARLELRGRRPAHRRKHPQRVGQVLGVQFAYLARVISSSRRACSSAVGGPIVAIALSVLDKSWALHFLIEASLICGGRRVANCRVRPQRNLKALGAHRGR